MQDMIKRELHPVSVPVHEYWLEHKKAMEEELLFQREEMLREVAESHKSRTLDLELLQSKLERSLAELRLDSASILENLHCTENRGLERIKRREHALLKIQQQMDESTYGHTLAVKEHDFFLLQEEGHIRNRREEIEVWAKNLEVQFLKREEELNQLQRQIDRDLALLYASMKKKDNNAGSGGGGGGGAGASAARKHVHNFTSIRPLVSEGEPRVIINHPTSLAFLVTPHPTLVGMPVTLSYLDGKKGGRISGNVVAFVQPNGHIEFEGVVFHGPPGSTHVILVSIPRVCAGTVEALEVNVNLMAAPNVRVIGHWEADKLRLVGRLAVAGLDPFALVGLDATIQLQIGDRCSFEMRSQATEANEFPFQFDCDTTKVNQPQSKPNVDATAAVVGGSGSKAKKLATTGAMTTTIVGSETNINSNNVNTSFSNVSQADQQQPQQQQQQQRQQQQKQHRTEASQHEALTWGQVSESKVTIGTNVPVSKYMNSFFHHFEVRIQNDAFPSFQYPYQGKGDCGFKVSSLGVPHKDLVTGVALCPQARLLVTTTVSGLADVFLLLPSMSTAQQQQDIGCSQWKLIKRIEHRTFISVATWSDNGRLLGLYEPQNSALHIWSINQLMLSETAAANGSTGTSGGGDGGDDSAAATARRRNRQHQQQQSSAELAEAVQPRCILTFSGCAILDIIAQGHDLEGVLLVTTRRHSPLVYITERNPPVDVIDALEESITAVAHFYLGKIGAVVVIGYSNGAVSAVALKTGKVLFSTTIDTKDAVQQVMVPRTDGGCSGVITDTTVPNASQTTPSLACEASVGAASRDCGVVYIVSRASVSILRIAPWGLSTCSFRTPSPICAVTPRWSFVRDPGGAPRELLIVHGDGHLCLFNLSTNRVVAYDHVDGGTSISSLVVGADANGDFKVCACCALHPHSWDARVTSTSEERHKVVQSIRVKKTKSPAQHPGSPRNTGGTRAVVEEAVGTPGDAGESAPQR